MFEPINLTINGRPAQGSWSSGDGESERIAFVLPTNLAEIEETLDFALTATVTAYDRTGVGRVLGELKADLTLKAS